MRRIRRSSKGLPGEDLELIEDYNEVVRKARMSLGLTQDELAKQVGEKVTIIKKVEAGELKPSISLARKLEKLLKVVLLVPAEEPLHELGRYARKGGELSGVRLGDILKLKKQGQR